MSLLALAGTNSATGGYDIDNSLKLEADNSEYLNRTPTANGSRTTWTTSVWVKRTEIGVDQAIFSAVNSAAQANFIRFRNTDQLRFYFQPDNTAITYYADTNAVFRDTSAWYHIVWGLDSTNSDGSKRFVVYVNGVYQESTWAGSSTASTNCAQNSGSLFLQSQPIQIGKGTYGADHYFNGYMADLHVLDGIAPDPTDFGEYDEDSGIWKPKAYTGSHGTQGFYLDFESSGSLGADSSGNSNNLTLNNITAADQATDTPTNNFCIFNVLQNNTTSGTNPTFTEGATVVNRSTGAGWMVYITTIPVNKGKWYAEFELERTNALQMQGTLPVHYAQTGATTTEYYLGAQANGDGGVGWYGSGSTVYHGGGYSSSTAAEGGDIIGVAIDCDNNKVHFRVNATWTNSSNPASGNSGGFAINDELTYIVLCSQPANRTYKANFGGYTTIDTSGAYTGSDADGYGTFKFAPPSGYYALCTKNLEEYG